MYIQALPQTTVRLIGASQAVTDAASVVKELVDNALDARATAIFIEISTNTLDTILVRDNGHGIAPGDRDMVCRRYCTSKIREYSDLESVGGKTLGFRGEALASATELCDALMVTTRVEGEDTATALKIDRTGEIHGRERASHPFGTTVRLTNLFENIPVRKQTALKTSSKCLARIKKCVQSYAFARPSLRFSLKIVKAKNDRGNWMYAPGPNGNAEDAAFKIVGKECASQCAWSSIEHEGFEVQAFLPTSNSNAAKISNIGQFLSIDARPVSATRGTLKQIITRFKDTLKASMTTSNDVKDPFLFLNIICPSNSYDPNVEPAKDDVVFENSATVLAAVQKLLDNFYPPPSEIDGTETPPIILMPAPAGFPVFTTPSRPSTQGKAVHLREDEQLAQNQDRFDVDIRSAKRQCTFRSNMRDFNEEDFDISEADEQSVDIDSIDIDDAQEGQEARNAGIRVSNPWTLAKINSSLRPKQSRALLGEPSSPPLQEMTRSDINSDFQLPPQTHLPQKPLWNLPTPDLTSSMGMPEPSEAFAAGPERDSPTSDGEQVSQAQIVGKSKRRQQLNIDNTLLSSARSDSHIPKAILGRRSTFFSGPNDFVSAKALPFDTFEVDRSNETERAPRRARKQNSRAPRGTFSNRSINNPYESLAWPVNSIPEHPYLHSSPPPMPVGSGFTPINRHYPTRDIDEDNNDGFPDIRNFLNRVRDEGLSSKTRERGHETVGGSVHNEYGPEYDSGTTFPGSTVRSRAHAATNNRQGRNIAAAADIQQQSKVTNQRHTDSAPDPQPQSSDLHNLILLLHTSIESLSALASKLELFNLPRVVFDINSTSGQAEPAVDADSTFVNTPPEALEMEEWRRQLLRFLQTADGRDAAEREIDIDIEGAVGALEDEAADRHGMHNGGAQTMYGSQESDMLIT